MKYLLGIKSGALKVFAAVRRPLAWVVLAFGVFGIVGTLAGWIATGKFFWPTLVGSVLVFNDGFQMVQEEESS